MKANYGKSMAEEATLKWSELKKLFQETDQKELISLLHDLYKNSVDNRRFITARYAKAGDENKILETYRKKVINVYYPPRGAASRPRYSVAKKAINDYFEASGDIKGTMDLALTLVENVMKYLYEFSGIDRSSYVGGTDMIEKFCELARISLSFQAAKGTLSKSFPKITSTSESIMPSSPSKKAKNTKGK